MVTSTRVRAALMVMFGGGLATLAAIAAAQDAPVQHLERVEVTGSALKRIDAETAVPITVLKLDELKKQGVTTVEQIVSRLASSQMTQGSSQGVGTATGGAAFANLRGLGQNKTLVLLNGRRLANNAGDSSAPDLNMIPFAVLDRVEVLRDGASALYGSDAIGGVINFITRKEFTGGVVTIGADQPQHAGGRATSASLGFGVGDLDKDRFNLYGLLDYQRQEPLLASQRPDLLARSVRPSGSTSPGQYNQGGLVQNPSYPGCGGPAGIALGNAGENCGYLPARETGLVPTSERLSGFLKGTLNLNADHQAGLEYFVARNRNSTRSAGLPYGNLYINPGTRYYPGNGITPAPTAFTLDPSYLDPNAVAGAQPGMVAARWRDTFSGDRLESTLNTQQRLVASLDGVLGGWDYQTALAYNENRLDDRITGGYTDGAIVTAGVLDGTINPFGDQDAAGAALLTSAAVGGPLWSAKGQTLSWDGRASRDVGDWFQAGRPAALALGAEVRHERYRQKANPEVAAKVFSSTGFDPAIDNGGSRNVAALYAELNVPLLKDLDITGALRHDHYSDVGGSTNPKLSFRYQPLTRLLVRGSYATGFRAPSLYELHGANVYTNTANLWDDPVLCPGGSAAPGANPATACGNQFLMQNGGNPALQPEKSRSLTLGLVLEPVDALTVSLDVWSILLKNQIFALPDTTLFGDPVQYASQFHRAPDGTLSFDGTQCPGTNCGYVEDHFQNHGNARTRGIDVGANYRWRVGDVGNFVLDLNGTYVDKFEYQNDAGGPWLNNLGVYAGGVALSANTGGPVFRWQHTLSLGWSRGPWAGGVVNHFKSHYIDQDPADTVASYTTWDVFGSWQAAKGFALTLGVRNLFDRAPPTSNQTATFQVGYDPRFADAIGRAFYARGSYRF